MSVTITVYGKVKGKARPRVTKHGVYTPKESKKYEREIAEKYRETGAEPFTGEVEVEVVLIGKCRKAAPKRL